MASFLILYAWANNYANLVFGIFDRLSVFLAAAFLWDDLGLLLYTYLSSCFPFQGGLSKFRASVCITSSVVSTSKPVLL
jgi:hypothetical protein